MGNSAVVNTYKGIFSRIEAKICYQISFVVADSCIG